MVTTLGVSSVLLLFALIVLLFRSAERSARLSELGKELSDANNKNKKLQSQLQGRSDKLSKKSHEASKKEEKVKGQLQRIEQQQVHLNEARTRLEDAQDTIKDLSREVNRLRIEREQLRENLAERQPKGQSTHQEEPVSDTTNSVDAGSSDEEKEPRNAKDARKMSFAKLERELEKASENEERLVEKLRQMKQAVIEREYKLRKATRKAEHNHRAYIITQLQLDLLSDENYVLIHGKQPPLKHSDKAAKRNLSIPTEEPVELLNEGGAIDLIGVGSRADEPFDPVEEEAKIQAAEAETDEPVQAEDPAVEPSEESSETVKAAKPAKKSTAKKKTAKKTAKTEEKASKPAKKAKKTTKKAAKPAKKAEKKVEAKDAEEEDKVKTTRLRKGGRTKTQASAPPRPEA